MKTLLSVRDLSKSFKVGKKRCTALSHIHLDIYENEILGLVGESGSGKSLLSRIILQLEKKDAGEILFRDLPLENLSSKELKRLRRKMQIIFQDPYASLDPRMCVRDIVGEALDIHRLATGDAREERIIELLDQVGLDATHLDRYPHEFSGGQRQRIGIARALAVDPEFIICDEPISALDVSIQAQVINLLKRVHKEKRLTYLFIAHDLSIVKYISTRVAVMYLGHIFELGTSEEIFNNPLHPYTQALLSSIAFPDPFRERARQKVVIKGEVPSILNPPTGCPFHPRCPKATSLCREKKPTMHEVKPGHFAYCHLFEERSL
jgi:peptide/nickel transport system ATP-binding protein/oligopeptide transport system ATP-binding protein